MMREYTIDDGVWYLPGSYLQKKIVINFCRKFSGTETRIFYEILYSFIFVNKYTQNEITFILLK